MKSILSLCLLTPLLTFSQFIMTKERISGTIVYNLDSISAENIYNNVLEFTLLDSAQNNFNKPKLENNSQIPNKSIRIEGSFKSPIKDKKDFSLFRESMDLLYSFLIDISDNKMSITCEGTQYAMTTHGLMKCGFEFVFDDKGNIKEKQVKYKQDIESAFKQAADHIYSYVKSK